MRSSGEYMNSLRIIHGAMLLLQVLFLAVVFWLVEPSRMPEHDLFFNIAGAVVLVLGFVLSYILPAKSINESKAKRGLGEKLNVYRTAAILNWALLDGVCVFLIVGYFMTGELRFVLASVFAMVALFLNRPTIDRIVYKLDLDESEQRTLENPNSAI